MIDESFDNTMAQYEALAAAYEKQRKEPQQSLSAPPQSGLEPLPQPPKEFVLCPSFDHQAPKYMQVPVGMRYRHVCPLCGTVSYVNSNIVYC